jgi:hypothetical protein
LHTHQNSLPQSPSPTSRPVQQLCGQNPALTATIIIITITISSTFSIIFLNTISIAITSPTSHPVQQQCGQHLKADLAAGRCATRGMELHKGEDQAGQEANIDCTAKGVAYKLLF